MINNGEKYDPLEPKRTQETHYSTNFSLVPPLACHALIRNSFWTSLKYLKKKILKQIKN